MFQLFTHSEISNIQILRLKLYIAITHHKVQQLKFIGSINNLLKDKSILLIYVQEPFHNNIQLILRQSALTSPCDPSLTSSKLIFTIAC